MSEEDRTALRRDILTTLMPGFAGHTMPTWIADAFSAGMRSVCVYGENVASTEQLRGLGAELRAACPEALIAIDEEGGEATRLHYLEGSPYPGAAVLGRIDDLTYTESIGERVGHDILSSGFNLALGPIADVNSNPHNPVIGTRSFSADPLLASKHVAAWVRGLQSTGAIACAKHFPGHGDTAQDSHLALPTVDVSKDELAGRELTPFRGAIDAGALSIMTSHILLPQVDPSGPATFSRVVLQGLLRDDLGFDGVIVSDALDMQGASGEVGIPEAAVLALIAGCDLLCLGTHTGVELLEDIQLAVLGAIDEGRLSAEQVADAASRVRGLAARSAGATRRSAPGPARPQLRSSFLGRPHSGVAERSNDSDAPAESQAALSLPEETHAAELELIIGSFAGLPTARTWLAAHPQASVIRVESEANMAVGHAPWGPFAAALVPLSYSGDSLLGGLQSSDLLPSDPQPSDLQPSGPQPGDPLDDPQPGDPQPADPLVIGNTNNEARRFAARSHFEAQLASDAAWSTPHPNGVMVIGRNLHRLPEARAGIDRLRSAGTSVLAVEMGWPEAEKSSAYADLCCYGSSRLVGAALLHLIDSEGVSA